MRFLDGLPIFKVNVEDAECSIDTISLVDSPAMELPMFCFNKEDQKGFAFSVQEAEHNIISCIIRTNYPIYRLNAVGEGYYLVFDRDSVKTLCQRLMTDGKLQNISLNHDGQLIEGIQLMELFIKDTTRGISPVGFDTAEEGSLFGIFHITDEALWQQCLDGTFGGVSLESILGIESFSKTKKDTKMSKLKELINQMLLAFNEVETDKGLLTWKEDSPLLVGLEVYQGDAPAADGEYVFGDKVAVVVEGKVVEIKDVIIPETMAEEDAAPEAEPVVEAEPLPEADDRLLVLEERIAGLEALVAEMQSKLAELAQAPAAAPVSDEFEKVTRGEGPTFDKETERYIKMFSNK